MIDGPQPSEPGYNFDFFELQAKFADDPGLWETVILPVLEEIADSKERLALAQDLPNIEVKQWERDHGARSN